MVSEPLHLRDARAHFYAQLPEPLIGGRSSDVAVYAYLDRRAGSRGYWHSSARALASDMSADPDIPRTIDESAVRRSLARLVASGLVALSRRTYREACYVLTERIAAPTPQCDHPDRGTHAAISRHPRRDRGDHTSIRSEKPTPKPIGTYPQRNRKQNNRAGEQYDRAALRDWPAVQRRLGL